MSRRSDIIYFKSSPGDPLPLTASVDRRVRFEEVDPLSIVWHGRYPSYFEDGRMAFGGKYGLDYLNMYKEDFIAPIVQLHIDYHNPLFFQEDFTIVTSLHWTEAVKLNFSYKIIKQPDQQIIATGYTVQILTNLNKELLLVRPEYLEHFFERWKLEQK